MILFAFLFGMILGLVMGMMIYDFAYRAGRNDARDR